MTEVEAMREEIKSLRDEVARLRGELATRALPIYQPPVIIREPRPWVSPPMYVTCSSSPQTALSALDGR